MRVTTENNRPLYPWSALYDRYYISVGKNGRKFIDLRNKYGDRTSTSYARYLMAIKLGYYVPVEFDVDHINNDPSDDRIENLQLLTREENRNKYLKYRLDSMSGTIDLINKYAEEGHYSTKIARILNIDRSTVKKYSALPLANGAKEANPKLLSKDTKDRINEFAAQGKSCHQISKLLSISDGVVKKYAVVPLANGLKEAHPNIIKQDIIDKINSYGPDINNDKIARLLDLDHTTVKKYRTAEYRDGRLPGSTVNKITKIPLDVIERISSPEYIGMSSKALAKKLNIDRTCIERYRAVGALDSNALFNLIEVINYRKRKLTLRQIRDRLNVGKNTMSKYAYYINRPDVQEQLKEHAVESYSYYDVLNRKKETTGSPSLDYLSYAVDSLSTYTAYDEYQINALKAFYDSNKDYTIYATVETTEDDIFLVISGTR